MDLGSAIKFIRKQQNISQKELVELAEISQTYLSQLENNQKEPNLKVLKQISTALKVPLPIIFFLALEDEDIPQNKRNIYGLISPTLKSMINEIFKV